MKKLLFVILFMLSFSLFADEYVVKSVVGKVTVNGCPVEVGQVFQDMDLLNVGVQSNVELVVGDQHLIIKAMSKGTVKDLWIKAHPFKGGLKKQTIVKASNIAPPVESTRKGVATAASRASEAKEDFDWDE